MDVARLRVISREPIRFRCSHRNVVWCSKAERVSIRIAFVRDRTAGEAPMLSLKKSADRYELTDTFTGESATLEGEDREEVISAWIGANAMLVEMHRSYDFDSMDELEELGEN